MRAPALLGCLALALTFPGCNDDSESSTKAEGRKSKSGCTVVERPEPRGEGQERAPTKRLDRKKRHLLVVKTNCGEFTIQLDTGASPKAAASLFALAGVDFYDNTIFHRIAPGFVIQGGDPTATGRGGPGYRTVDPPAQYVYYGKGIVGMAKAEEERPGTGGSQFFVVTAGNARLPPEYAVVGEVLKGQRVVDRIGALGDRQQRPTEVVVIEDVVPKVTRYPRRGRRSPPAPRTPHAP